MSTPTRGVRRRPSAMPNGLRPIAILAGAIALAELTGLVTGRHKLIPTEVLVDAVVQGLPAALFAVGLVLVYRASRIINFAQGGLAVGAGIVFLTLQGEHWPYLLCAGAALAAAVVTGVAMDAFLLRRFVTAPRLVATVVTIVAGQLIVSLAALLPSWRFGGGASPAASGTGPGQRSRVPVNPAHSPFTTLHRRWGVLVFTGDHIVAVVATVLVGAGLILFFRRARSGIAIRGAAENAEKAAILGISTSRLSALVWALAAGLAGLSALIGQPMNGTTLASATLGLGTASLLRGLAAGVIGKMEDLPTTIAAAVGLSAFTAAVFFSTTNASIVEVVLLLVLAGALVAQRASLGRAQPTVAAGWAAAEEIRTTPAILRNHISVRGARRWLTATGVVVLAGYPFAMSPSQVYLGATFAIFGIVLISLVVLTGWGGQISLGQFALVAVGASIGGTLAQRGWPFPLAWAVATVVGGLIAVILGLPALRIRGLLLAVMTLAFALVTADFFLDANRFPSLVPNRVPRPRLLFVNFDDDRAFYFLALAGLIAAIFAAKGLRSTRTGRVLIAMRDNERGAQALGLSLVRVRLVTFAISGALASFAGMLYASHLRSVHPDGFGPDLSVQIFLMAILGGLGSVTGVLTGAIYLGCVQLFIHNTATQLFAGGIGVLVVLLFFPSGLGGLVFAARDAFLRRVALREKILVPSLLGDLRTLTSEAGRFPLGPKPDMANRVRRHRRYTIDSDIAEAGSSQRGRGWVYG